MKAFLISLSVGGGMAVLDAMSGGELNPKRLGLIFLFGSIGSAKLYLANPDKPAKKGDPAPPATKAEAPPPVDPGGQ